MEHEILSIFNLYSNYAIVISIVINVLISILGIIPSFFLTTANIVFFGFWLGTIISFIGEVIGAIFAFYIYRLGFRKLSNHISNKDYPKLKALLEVQGRDAFLLILSFRFFPFIPSGSVNLFAALGKVSFLIFVLASSLGKIPSMLIEAYSIVQILEFSSQGKFILIIVSIYFFIFVVRNLKNRSRLR